MRKISVLLGMGRDLFRDGLANLLIGCGRSLHAAAALAKRTRPDVLLLDTALFLGDPSAAAGGGPGGLRKR